MGSTGTDSISLQSILACEALPFAGALTGSQSDNPLQWLTPMGLLLSCSMCFHDLSAFLQAGSLNLLLLRRNFLYKLQLKTAGPQGQSVSDTFLLHAMEQNFYYKYRVWKGEREKK